MCLLNLILCINHQCNIWPLIILTHTHLIECFD